MLIMQNWVLNPMHIDDIVLSTFLEEVDEDEIVFEQP